MSHTQYEKGIPPVGISCEVSCEDHADYEWVKINVIAEHKGVIIGIVDMPGEPIDDEINKYAIGYNGAKFRRIRTEIERKREETIADLQNALGHAHGLFDLALLYEAMTSGSIRHITLK